MLGRLDEVSQRFADDAVLYSTETGGNKTARVCFWVSVGVKRQKDKLQPTVPEPHVGKEVENTEWTL